MRIKEIININEMPVDVKQDAYPFNKQDLSKYNVRDTNQFVKVLDKGGFQVYGDNLGGYGPPDQNAENTFSAYKFAETYSSQGMHPKVFGQISLTSGLIGRGISDVHVMPDYRNKGLGKLMYKILILDLSIKLETAAALTPSSNRVWNSLYKDPQINVFAVKTVKGNNQPKVERFDNITFDGEFLQVKGERRSRIRFVAEPANS